MGIEKARTYFKKWDLDHRILEFDVSSATVELAAKAVGCNEERIAKTLSFIIDDEAILIVVAGDAKVDNKKYKSEFKTKAKMISPEKAIELVGYPVGGICPFAINEGVIVYLDESLRRFETVYPACGSSNSAIKLTIEELEKHSNYDSWIDVCKGWER